MNQIGARVTERILDWKYRHPELVLGLWQQSQWGMIAARDIIFCVAFCRSCCFRPPTTLCFCLSVCFHPTH